MSDPSKFKPQGLRSRFPQQYIALLKKNALVAWRNKSSTLLRILAPCIFIVLVLLLDFAVRADTNASEQFKELRTPERQAIVGIPTCESDIYIQAPCFDFIYSPNTEASIETIVENIRNNNEGRAIDADRVKGFANLEEANAWLLENPEMTGAGVHFDTPDATTIDFTLQLNSTVKFFRGKTQNVVDYIGMPLQVAAHRETARQLAIRAGQELTLFDIGWKLFAHPVNSEDSLIGTFMGLFLFVASMFSFVMTMTSVIGERETKVTQALQTMGMMRSAYWLSWITWEILLSFVIVLIAMAFGATCQINFFLKNAFGVVFFTLFTFQLAMVGFAYFVASFLRKTSTAISLGFTIFLIGFVFQLVVNFDIPYSRKYYKKWGSILTIVFSAMPWCPFAKAINDLGEATLQDSSAGLKWKDRYSYCEYDDGCRMPLPLAWGVLLIEFFAYSLLAIYLTAVLPNENGVREPPHFFLMPSFWQPRKFRASDVVREQRTAPQPATVDDDVAAEVTKMRQRLESGASALTEHAPEATLEGAAAASNAPAIEMYGIQRRFGGRPEFWAVVDSWLEIPNNQLFCLLGPNGAGKSTVINILTGVLPPSGGDAVMVGESIRTTGGMDEIRTNMGVCPQFDILWHELTSREHMILFGNIKGLATSDLVATEADTLLKEVNLTYAANQRAGSFSGGMKRRLSVACALLGDPKLVFLDEPTTGMDPVSRRQVWDIIERAKQGRAIILTTHSMEEADILGDRIAIMARGNLRCLGTSLRLKQKFGAGYQVAISVAKDEGDTPEAAQQRAVSVKTFIKDTYGFEPLSESSAYITYLIARSDEERLPAMLKNLENNTSALEISDIQIALTTLEEVFLNIAKQAEIENAQGKDVIVQAEVDGKLLPVQVGQELVTDPATNKSYRLAWGQNHNGELCVSEVFPLPA